MAGGVGVLAGACAGVQALEVPCLADLERGRDVDEQEAQSSQPRCGCLPGSARRPMGGRSRRPVSGDLCRDPADGATSVSRPAGRTRGRRQEPTHDVAVQQRDVVGPDEELVGEIARHVDLPDPDSPVTSPRARRLEEGRQAQHRGGPCRSRRRGGRTRRSRGWRRPRASASHPPRRHRPPGRARAETLEQAGDQGEVGHVVAQVEGATRTSPVRPASPGASGPRPRPSALPGGGRGRRPSGRARGRPGQGAAELTTRRPHGRRC